MTTPKICMIVSNSVHRDPRPRKEATICVKHGFDVVVVGLFDERYDHEAIQLLPFRVSLLRNPFRKRIPYLGIAGNIFRNVAYRVFNLIGLLRRCCAERADIYHSNDYDTLLVGWLAAKFTRAKVVYDTHEICSENHCIANKLQKSILIFFESFLIRRVNKVVSVSHSAAEFIANLYSIPTPEVITNCAWSLDQSQSATNSAKFEILNHGQFYNGRGYDLLIESARFLKLYCGRIGIVLRGFGPSEDEYRQLILSEGADELVQIVPPVAVDQLSTAATSSHIGVAITDCSCLNFRHSISNKIFEYLVAGLPVLMSDIPEHRYYNDKYMFGIVLHDLSPSTIANAIIELYEDKVLYSRLKSNVLEARKVLCWEVEGEKWISLYHGLLKT